MTARQVVAAVLAELPDEERETIKNVNLRLAGRPEAVDFRRGCLAAQKGYYWGTRRELGRQGEAAIPDGDPPSGEIVIFLENLNPMMAARLRIVLLHEIAHALGWDEEEIEAAGFCLYDDRQCCSPL